MGTNKEEGNKQGGNEAKEEGEAGNGLDAVGGLETPSAFSRSEAPSYFQASPRTSPSLKVQPFS